MKRLLLVASVAWLLTIWVSAAPQSSRERLPAPHPERLFQTSDNCLACHNGLTSPAGEDVSIGADWRASMMANSSRDPYWQAAVRREVADHPAAQAAIEDECSVCHMPMTRTAAHAAGRTGQIFENLPVTTGSEGDQRFAHDGVSCTVCHQITAENFGTAESFSGGYVIDASAKDPRPMYGPFEVDKGRTTIMRSSTEYRPAESAHVRQSELCATCHTLYTNALDANGRSIGRLPEQMPYLEWKHSSFAATKSCQACHMPAVADTPMASTLGEPRTLARHTFRGGNFFMLRMLNRFRADLGVLAPASELGRAAEQTVQHLQTETAGVRIDRLAVAGTRLEADVRVDNASGHKLPTGYPSRRVWLHVTVRDATNRLVFESGAIGDNGQIAGNDADTSAAQFEPHHAEISDSMQVQVYESVMVDTAGAPTTGLLRGVRYAKDNRLLPRGFDKASAASDIAVVGGAAEDADFTGGSDLVRYRIDVGVRPGPFQVDVELRFQPIAYRWAQSLAPYDSSETRRFLSYYEQMSRASSEILARSSAQVSLPR